MIYLPFIFIFIIALVLTTSLCMILVHLVWFRILLSFLLFFIRSLLLILASIFCSVHGVILSIVAGVSGVRAAWLLRFFITRNLI